MEIHSPRPYGNSRCNHSRPLQLHSRERAPTERAIHLPEEMRTLLTTPSLRNAPAEANLIRAEGQPLPLRPYGSQLTALAAM